MRKESKNILHHQSYFRFLCSNPKRFPKVLGFPVATDKTTFFMAIFAKKEIIHR